MYETKQYFYGTGRRKHSVARVRVYNGTGKITINNRDIDDYFGLETLKLMVRSPLALTNTDGKFDIVINVVGGGTSGQAGAIRHGLSRALLQFDPELRSTQSGTDVMSFGVAVNDRRRNPQTNEWEDYPNFVDCTMFGNRARSLHQYLSKGTKVAIEGKLRWSQWERDGQKRSKLEVIVDELEFMSSRNGGGAQSYGGDFGDRPCDYNFCGNGIAYGDGEESPKMQEVKYNYQDIFAKVTDTKAVVTNRAMFTNTSAYDCVVILARNGEIIASAPLETDVPPMESREYALPFARQTRCLLYTSPSPRDCS